MTKPASTDVDTSVSTDPTVFEKSKTNYVKEKISLFERLFPKIPPGSKPPVLLRQRTEDKKPPAVLLKSSTVAKVKDVFEIPEAERSAFESRRRFQRNSIIADDTTLPAMVDVPAPPAATTTHTISDPGTGKIIEAEPALAPALSIFINKAFTALHSHDYLILAELLSVNGWNNNVENLRLAAQDPNHLNRGSASKLINELTIETQTDIWVKALLQLGAEKRWNKLIYSDLLTQRNSAGELFFDELYAEDSSTKHAEKYKLRKILEENLLLHGADQKFNLEQLKNSLITRFITQFTLWADYYHDAFANYNKNSEAKLKHFAPALDLIKTARVLVNRKSLSPDLINILQNDLQRVTELKAKQALMHYLDQLVSALDSGNLDRLIALNKPQHNACIAFFEHHVLNPDRSELDRALWEKIQRIGHPQYAIKTADDLRQLFSGEFAERLKKITAINDKIIALDEIAENTTVAAEQEFYNSVIHLLQDQCRKLKSFTYQNKNLKCRHSDHAIKSEFRKDMNALTVPNQLLSLFNRLLLWFANIFKSEPKKMTYAEAMDQRGNTLFSSKQPQAVQKVATILDTESTEEQNSTNTLGR